MVCPLSCFINLGSVEGERAIKLHSPSCLVSSSAKLKVEPLSNCSLVLWLPPSHLDYSTAGEIKTRGKPGNKASPTASSTFLLTHHRGFLQVVDGCIS